ncbi:Lysophospholipase 1 [Elasticomyces elasticus]|nr:Lysophospholipase 1 [Elasticomyces elasticus]
MKYSTILAGVALAASSTSVVIRNPTAEEAAAEILAAPLVEWKRATDQSPKGYTPSLVDCPSDRPTIRAANTLSDQETTWLQTRRNNTVSPMRTLLGRLNVTGLDTNSYIDSHANNASALPNIGIAASGGGYRALLNGAGALAAFDDRTVNATASGHLGGLLQSATYLAGLSGGGWLVGSLYTNNFTSVQSIIDKNNNGTGSLWQFGNSIFEGPRTGSIQLISSVEYFSTIHDAVSSKGNNFNVTITDYWGRALSYQLVNAPDGGPGYTFSSIQKDVDFAAGNTPMPILIADGRAPGETLIPINTTVYEFNPWELGSWDQTVHGFVPLQYVGSNFTAGNITGNEQCVIGFDNVGFVMGTSSTLFNQFLLQINTTAGIPQVAKTAIADVLGRLGNAQDDIADYPNPFYQYRNSTNLNAQAEMLTLVDGGEDLENIPLHPLIQPIRHVDVIFAIDSSADTVAPAAAGWPNGTALVATYERSLSLYANGTNFPAIPDQNTFVNLGLNSRPTFFGCDSHNTTHTTPLIVYLPNAPYVYNSNVSTFDPAYNTSERNAIISNGLLVASLGNGTLDSQWPTCVGCAILSRSLEKTGTTVPDVCKACFKKYCWDGTLNSATPAGVGYSPTMKLPQNAIKVTSGASGFGVVRTMSWMAAVAVSAWLIV